MWGAFWEGRSLNVRAFREGRSLNVGSFPGGKESSCEELSGREGVFM